MEHTLVELKSVESFNISGRGTIYTIDMSKIEPGRKILVGDRIMLDGKEAILTSVEMASGRQFNRSLTGITVRYV